MFQTTRKTLTDAIGKPCPYCASVMDGVVRRPTRDHVQARARGGKLDDSNKLVVCHICNQHKGSGTLQQFCESLTACNDPRAKYVRRLIDKRLWNGKPRFEASR